MHLPVRILTAVQENLRERESEQHSRARSESPDFDVFDYVHPQENLLSRMIGDLLDPLGTHGQGEAFLCLFLELLELGWAAETDTAKARVKLESQALVDDARRRIDIEISGPDWVVGIENKLGAPDQLNQVSDYLHALASRASKRHSLIYLTPEGRPPTSSSISKTDVQSARQNGHLRLANYGQIAQWLAQCQMVCQSPRVRWYLNALQSHVERSVLGHLPPGVEAMIISTVLDEAHAAELSSVLHLLQAKPSIERELQRRVMDSIRSLLPNSWEICNALDSAGSLELRLKRRPGWTFGVESQGRRPASRWWYGMAFDREATQSQRVAVREAGLKLKTRLPGGTPNDYWAYWRWFEGLHEHEPKEYGNWDSSIQPWLDMPNGVMAGHLLALAMEFESAISSELDT